MPTVHFENEPLPSPEEFRQALRDAMEQYDPLEELLSLERELVAQEQKYGLSSAEFYRRFLAGQTGDDPDLVAWVGEYEAYLHLKQTIAQSLNLVLSGPMAPGD